jgi:nucleotide-binding universal stress UspA family protein
MYNKILIATDGSDLAARALEHGAQLAKAVGAEVVVVTVIEPAALMGGGYASVAGTVYDPIPELIEAQKEATAKLLKGAVDKVAAFGVTATSEYVDNSFPAEGIISTAERVDADLIIMGSHGRRGIGRLLLGSQTNEVLAHTKLPVLVTR